MTVITRVPPGHYPLDDALNVVGDLTGVNDVTAALNACIDYCRDARLILLIPTGVVLKVSDTIRLLKNDADNWSNPPAWQVLCLVGQHGAQRPKIRLVDGATGFGTGNRKPIVHILMASVAGQSYAEVTDESPSLLYRSVLHGIDIDCGNNPGAVGLLFDAAQESHLSNVRISGANYSAGIEGLPGRSMCSRNIEIAGTMQYGIRLSNGRFGGSTGLGAVLSNLSIEGSTVAAISHGAARGALAIAGLRIKTASGVAANCTGGRFGEYGNLVIKDGLIELGSPGGTAINAQFTGVFLQRVYTKNAALICDHYATARDFAGESAGWHHTDLYIGGHSRADANALSSNGTVGEPRYFRTADGQLTAASIRSPSNGAVTASAVPDWSFFQSQHQYTPPDPTDPDVLYATEATTTPACFNDNTTDNAGRPQAKVDEAAAAGKALFFPAGTYKVSQKLTLHNNSIVFGAWGSQSRFSATNAWRTAINNAGVETWYFDTDDDANATTQLQNMVADCIVYAATWLGFLRWRAGRRSVRAELTGLIRASGRFDRPICQVRVNGHGGGRPWNIVAGASLQNSSAAMAAFHPDYRHQIYEGGREPCTIYGLNLEYGGSPERTPSHAAVALFDDVRNVFILSSKCEAQQAVIELANGAEVTIGQVAVLSSQAVPVGPCLKLDASSSLTCGPIANVWANTAGTVVAPGASTALVVQELPTQRTVSPVYRTAVFGGYVQGNTLPATTWDIDQPHTAPLGATTLPTDGAANAGTLFTVIPPTGLQAGDLLVLFHSHRGTGTPAAIPVIGLRTTGGQVWTRVAVDQSVTNSAVALWTCVFNGTWTGDLMIGADNTGGTVAVVAGFRGPPGTVDWRCHAASRQRVEDPPAPYEYRYAGWSQPDANTVYCLFAACSSGSRTFTAPVSPWLNLLPTTTQIRCISTATQSVVAHYQVSGGAVGDDAITGNGGNAAVAVKFSATPLTARQSRLLNPVMATTR